METDHIYCQGHYQHQALASLEQSTDSHTRDLMRQASRQEATWDISMYGRIHPERERFTDPLQQVISTSIASTVTHGQTGAAGQHHIWTTQTLL